MIKEDQLYSMKEIAENRWLMLGYMGVYALVRSGRLKAIIVSAKGEQSGNKRYAIMGKEIIRFRSETSNIKKF